MSKQKIGYIIKAIFSLSGTSWLLLVSTSVSLYLKNQGELYYRYEVLYFFLVAALSVYALATLFFFLLKNKLLWYSVWGYLLLAPLFLAYTAVIGKVSSFWMQTGLCVLLLGVFLCAIFFLNRKYKVQQAVPFFALMTSAFIVIDIYSFM